MRNSSHGLQVFLACLASFLLAFGSHAEVYKWVDAAGQTHYSQKKSDANGAKAAEVKITRSPQPSRTSVPSTEYLQAQSKFAPRSPTAADTLDQQAFNRSLPSASQGKEHGTDGSRCALARDVLSGAVRHGNGKPTDQYDRDVAQNDIRIFCRSR